MKKILNTGIGLALCIGAISQTQHNYAEALQKSLYFYDAEKCGTGITGGRLEWRGDCHVSDSKIKMDGSNSNLPLSLLEAYPNSFDPDGDGFIDVSGGFHDAGDHVKFGLPQSYATSTLEWAFYEFREAFEEIGEADHIKDILRWGADYYLRCTFTDNNGDVIAFCYQLGEGSVDHNYWGPPELQLTEKFERPAYFATANSPASDQAAGAAASLAGTYLNFKDEDPAYAQNCLEKAMALYDFAVAHRGTGYDGGFYNSSFDEDELSWAAVWLYIATGTESYLTDIISISETGQYTGWLKKIIATTQDNWQNIWVHSWDTKWGGVFAKLAPITNDPNHWYIFRWNLEYWSGIPHEDTGDGSYLQKTDAGFSFLNSWGSARYNAAAQMQALVYRKYTNRTDFADWAKTQMDYILGDNPMGRSYLVGYSDNHAEHPHHRAAHGSSTNSMLLPENHKHMLWGALVGGPDAADNHKDETSDYVYNEVAIDYNAGAVGALAGHYWYYGRDTEPLENFPPKEEKVDEYYVEAKVEQENTERSQISLLVHNATLHPPRMDESIKVRYFFNISELLEAGQSINDVNIEVYYDESDFIGEPTLISGPTPWNLGNNTYYVEFDWSGIYYYGSRTIQFALIVPQDDTWTSHWDSSNDFSRQGISDTGLTKSAYIPLYINNSLIVGMVPDSGGFNAPVAIIKAEATSGIVPFATSLSAQDSYDPDGGGLEYLWTLSDGTNSNEAVINVELTDTGAFAYSLVVTDDTGLEDQSDIVLTALPEGSETCNLMTLFDVPRATPVPATDQNSEYLNVYVLQDGPDLSNVTKFSINWDLANNGLYQFALYTNNGNPNWYVDLTGNIQHTMNQSEPTITISNSGINGLDNTYYVNAVNDGLVLVQTDGDYAILFTNAAEVPDCESAPKSTITSSYLKPQIMPNPVLDFMTITNISSFNNIKIIDAKGAVMYSKNFFDKTEINVDLSYLKAGLYHVILRNNEGTQHYDNFIVE